MDKYRIIILQPQSSSEISLKLTEEFAAKVVTSQQDCLALAAGEEYKVIVLDLSKQKHCNLKEYEELLQDEDIEHLPLVVLSPTDSLKEKLEAFELGCDDVIGPKVLPEEACARINKAIFHCIANEQLKSRLRVANETAFSAMSDNSDLGSNLQFLVGENNCENLDELGQLLFATIEHYQLSCSLQMRSVFGVKNMEANGLAKDLESQLLEQLQGAGRFIDFGCRTIVNYGQASLLIRNMPVEDQKRYGSIKDNFPALLQGLDARIKALDARNQLLHEKEALQKLSENVRDVITQIDESYQKVMRDIATVVEDMADSIQSRIPILALSLEQEQFFESTIVKCVVDTNRVFNEGLKVDEVFKILRENMDNALCRISIVENELAENGKVDNDANDEAPLPSSKPRSSGGIELF